MRFPLLAVLLAANPATPTLVPIPVPDGQGGVGFDDLGFSAALHAILVPAGRTGNLILIDPRSQMRTVIGGFSVSGPGAGHGQGTTSADEGGGLVFASDRSKKALVVVDPAKRAIVGSVELEGGPDYVRFLNGEVWVTEPSVQQIEVFAVSPQGKLSRAGVVKVPGGPESLVADGARAYTHLWKAETVAIDLKSRAIAGRWKNGCKDSRGIALDGERGLLFAGCAEGKATAMDVRRGGAVVSSAATANGVDVIAYAPGLQHLYVPGEESGNMTVLTVSKDGKLSALATIPTAKGAHCVVADNDNGVWICDPERGRLLLFRDLLK